MSTPVYVRGAMCSIYNPSYTEPSLPPFFVPSGWMLIIYFFSSVMPVTPRSLHPPGWTSTLTQVIAVMEMVRPSSIHPCFHDAIIIHKIQAPLGARGVNQYHDLILPSSIPPASGCMCSMLTNSSSDDPVRPLVNEDSLLLYIR